MLEACLIPARESFLPSADARWPAPSIAVGYLEPDALRAPRVRDTLDVLVPTGSGNLFATFRDSQGQERTALVRAPLVSVVPPGLPHALADQPGARTLVLGIARAVFAQAAVAALDGAEPALREPHAAADPLLRHIGDAVAADMRQQRPFDPRYLESLAAVLAMHVARHYAVAVAAGGCVGGLAPHKLQRVREYIAQHLGELHHRRATGPGGAPEPVPLRAHVQAVHRPVAPPVRADAAHRTRQAVAGRDATPRWWRWRPKSVSARRATSPGSSIATPAARRAPSG